MSDSSPTSAGEKLLRLFDPDPVIAEERLRRCLKKLEVRFAAERCRDPEDLASKTIRRVLDDLRKKEREIPRIEPFIWGFATNIIRESRSSPINKEEPLDNLSPSNEPRTSPLDEMLLELSEDESKRLCLARCLDELGPDEREMLLKYYSSEDGEKQKQARERMAASSGLTRVQLKKRVFNLRQRLADLVAGCLNPRNKTRKSSYLIRDG
jgi:DNA-directed RNA polymerase specialized sigma24 family protein